ncbi:aspartate/glutamate racemase family protein [Thermococcus sp.]
MIVVLDPIKDEEGIFEKEVREYLSAHYPNDAFEVLTLEKGPASIGNFTQKTLACSSVLELVDKLKNASAVLINCFADPCLFELRENLEVPVFGAGETTMHIASMLGEFAVVGPGDNLISWTRIQAREYGVFDKLVSVRKIKLPVEEVLNNNQKVYEETKNACLNAIGDGADVVVLGCTGFANIAEKLSREIWDEFKIPILEPLLTTYSVTRSLYPILKHGKRGLFSGR